VRPSDTLPAACLRIAISGHWDEFQVRTRTILLNEIILLEAFEILDVLLKYHYQASI